MNNFDFEFDNAERCEQSKSKHQPRPAEKATLSRVAATDHTVVLRSQFRVAERGCRRTGQYRADEMRS
jgi:hypothetical protein